MIVTLLDQLLNEIIITIVPNFKATVENSKRFHEGYITSLDCWELKHQKPFKLPKKKPTAAIN